MKKKNSLILESDVKHIADLSNLELTPQKIKKFQNQLSTILDYVNQLNEVNTDGVEPTSQITGISSVTQEDVVYEGRTLSSDEALKNAKSTKNNYFKVKAIFEEDPYDI